MSRIHTVTKSTRADALAAAEEVAANLRAGGEQVTVGKVYEVVTPHKYGQISVELIVGGPETETNATDPVFAAIVYDDPSTNAESTALTSNITATESGLVLPNGVEVPEDTVPFNDPPAEPEIETPRKRKYVKKVKRGR